MFVHAPPASRIAPALFGGYGLTALTSAAAMRAPQAALTGSVDGRCRNG